MDVKLIAFKPSGERIDVPLNKADNTIGRGEDCEMRLPVPSVSRQHCRVTISEDAVTVKDLGSANGTFVNGDRVTEIKINPGDTIKVGPVSMVFQIDGRPEQIESLEPAAEKETPKEEPEPQKKPEEKSEEKPEEKPIELEAAEVEESTGMSPEDALSSLQPKEGKGKEIDPISALEQLASHSEKKKKKQE